MKWEAGKEYRTRAGRVARIYATDGYGSWPIHGAVRDATGWAPVQWMETGRIFGTNDESQRDLMPPAREVFVWEYPDGTLDLESPLVSGPSPTYSRPAGNTGTWRVFREVLEEEE